MCVQRLNEGVEAITTAVYSQASPCLPPERLNISRYRLGLGRVRRITRSYFRKWETCSSSNASLAQSTRPCVACDCTIDSLRRNLVLAMAH